MAIADRVPQTPFVALTINDKNARTTWGIIPNTKLLSTLLMPPPAKDVIKSTSRLEHGSRVIIPETGKKKASRELTLEVGLQASSMTDFITKYNSFIEELTSGWLNIRTDYAPGVTFRCHYLNCTQLTQYNGRLAKFILKLEEPNPNNRS